jgi:hypothetical protein
VQLVQAEQAVQVAEPLDQTVDQDNLQVAQALQDRDLPVEVALHTQAVVVVAPAVLEVMLPQHVRAVMAGLDFRLHYQDN